MGTAKTWMTADDLFALPDDGLRHELVGGELRTMTPAGYEHGKVVARLTSRVWQFVEPQNLGDVLGAETGFLIATDPETVRAPDLAFVASGRVQEVAPGRGYGRGAPDLAAEVVSPRDSYEEVDLKVRDWLRAGAQLVWVLNPRARTVAVHRPGEGVAILSDSDELTGGPVLPGFVCRVSDLFP